MMSFNRWVLGAATAGLLLGAASAQAAPLSVTPMGESMVRTVQFFFDDEPPVYYDPPPRPYYRDYPPPRRDYYPPPPGPYYGPRVYNGPPPPRYAQPRYQPPRVQARQGNRGGPPAYYTKDQVRAWNRANGF